MSLREARIAACAAGGGGSGGEGGTDAALRITNWPAKGAAAAGHPRRVSGVRPQLLAQQEEPTKQTEEMTVSLPGDQSGEEEEEEAERAIGDELLGEQVH